MLICYSYCLGVKKVKHPVLKFYKSILQLKLLILKTNKEQIILTNIY